MENNTVISVEHVNKVYKLYPRPMDRLIDTFHLMPWRKYGEHHALKDVSFTVNKGETVGIIGTNGSGKSTILKIITGVLHQTSGEVNVNGRISALLELGAGFNSEYTGMENIYLNGTMIGFSKEEIDAKLQGILEFADIGEFVYQPVKTYSSGMFVRLAFAIAINIEPEILIVDEALSVGDVFFQAKCYRKFDEFKKMGKTILFVSHDLSSISKYWIDAYKQVLVGQYSKDGSAEDAQSAVDAVVEKGLNPETLEYGSGKGTITSVHVTDEKGRNTNAIIKGAEFTVHMEVEAKEELQAPIFAFSIKNVKGTEITGTNTMFEKTFLGSMHKGEKKEATFTQRMTLQGGEYLLSFGLTGYEGSDFTVYHRLYDSLNITVISDKDTVGFYDMESKVEVKDVGWTPSIVEKEEETESGKDEDNRKNHIG